MVRPSSAKWYDHLPEGIIFIRRFVAGSEAYVSALAFYGYVKMLAEKDVPRAKAVYEELKKRFPFGRRKTDGNKK